MSEKRKYDSTVARIAGNILSGQKDRLWGSLGNGQIINGDKDRAAWAVALARAIVAEVERTEHAPRPQEDEPR